MPKHRQCLVTCGKGMRHRQVSCTTGAGEEKLSEHFCDPSSKPSTVGSCKLPECATWQVGVWGACAVTCGLGYQMRAVRCVSGDYGDSVDDRECNVAARPRDSQDCEMPACPRTSGSQITPRPDNTVQLETQWRFGSWTSCSVSCGKGKLARYVSCRDAEGGVADESYCAHLPRPPEFSTCFSPCGQWHAGEWSAECFVEYCSVTCGVGRTTRHLVCSNYHQPVDQSFCDPDERPAAEQECTAAPCPSAYNRQHIYEQPYGYPQDPGHHPGHSSWNVPSADNQWRTGPWGACSSTCAGGFHRRVVVCQDADGRSNSYCDERVKPAESKSCDSGPCPLWNYGVWGECTQTCGGGRKTRLVVCQRPSGQRLNDYNCDVLDKPPDVEQCNLQSCPGAATWHRRPWKPPKSNEHEHSSNLSPRGGARPPHPHNHPQPPPLLSPRRSTPPPACLFSAEEVLLSFMSKRAAGICGAKGPATQALMSAERTPCLKCLCNYSVQDACLCSVCCRPHRQEKAEGGFVRKGTLTLDPFFKISEVPKFHNERSSSFATHRDSRSSLRNPSACSVSCGRGTKQREIACVVQNQTQIKDAHCSHLPRPRAQKACRARGCPAWKANRWREVCLLFLLLHDPLNVQYRPPCRSHKHTTETLLEAADRTPNTPGLICRTVYKANCSVTCGSGVQERDVYCRLKGSGQVREDLCSPHLRPPTVQVCQTAECTRYTWVTGEWEQCNATCGEGMKSRTVRCVGPGPTPAHDDRCGPSTRPASLHRCREEPCPYTWITGEWSQCSASCGVGYQQRFVSCSLLPSSLHSQRFHTQPSSAGKICPEPHPPATQPCFLRECPHTSYWKVGPWTKCSLTCGAGMMERRVECVTSEGQMSKHCRPSDRPESQAACQERQSYWLTGPVVSNQAAAKSSAGKVKMISSGQVFTSCRDIQRTQRVRMDGEYYLKVKFRTLQIYCAEMQTDFPKEYVTLRSGQTDNYSEVYGHRLINPFECPYNGSRRQDCECRNDYSAAGYTLFHKVRLDLSSLQIMITDLQFSQTIHGRPVPFATAGDCYSAAKCPQGQFSINLIGTGLKVAPNTKWTSQGNYVSVKVHRSEIPKKMRLTKEQRIEIILMAGSGSGRMRVGSYLGCSNRILTPCTYVSKPSSSHDRLV
ncbi:hypothetical protein CCH79_00016334 [Gambusia affinis]|uniref:GON domain-containing protein n=1 Tax=Gambusia affinis TaxID=33528 RepID=A0A315W9G4_GAMAF|nr:hypothetical protein CCH79_00016334 [Gambusia affinis]